MVKHLQLEGKKATNAAEFLRGYPQIVGEILGLVFYDDNMAAPAR